MPRPGWPHRNGPSAAGRGSRQPTSRATGHPAGVRPPAAVRDLEGGRHRLVPLHERDADPTGERLRGMHMSVSLESRLLRAPWSALPRRSSCLNRPSARGIRTAPPQGSGKALDDACLAGGREPRRSAQVRCKAGESRAAQGTDTPRRIRRATLKERSHVPIDRHRPPVAQPDRSRSPRCPVPPPPTFHRPGRREHRGTAHRLHVRDLVAKHAHRRPGIGRADRRIQWCW